jgi:hypothetical protein
MGKDIQLTGTVHSYELTEDEIRVTTDGVVTSYDLTGDIHNSNTSEVLSFEIQDELRIVLDLLSLSFERTENENLYTTSGIITSYNLTGNNIQEINSSEVLSYELRDYDARTLEFRIVLEFFNETGGVF